MSQAPSSPSTPAETATEIRRLLHDMNNGLEIIIQASYLVGTLKLSEDGQQWMKLLDQGVQQVATLTRQLRDIVVKSQDSQESTAAN